MSYPHIGSYITPESFIQHFTIRNEDRAILAQARTDRSRLGLAIVLKVFLFLGYPPDYKEEIPIVIIERISRQLGLDPTLFQGYRGKDRIWMRHLSAIREWSGFRPCEKKDRAILLEWLLSARKGVVERKELMAAAISRCRECRLELPPEAKLWRVINSARRQSLEILYRTIAERIDQPMREHLDKLIEPTELEFSQYDWVKSPPGPMGMTTILDEVAKLQFIRRFGIDSDRVFSGISRKILKYLKNRARAEDAFQIRRHPPEVRYTLLAVLLLARSTEITDAIIKIFLELIHRSEKKADKAMEANLIQDIKKIYGKNRILFSIARAVTERPDGTVREVIFPHVDEPVFRSLIEEFERNDTRYDVSRTHLIRKKFGSFYRRMLRPVLDNLVFRSDNPSQCSLLRGLGLVHRYLGTKHTYYPYFETDEIPRDLLTGIWPELVFEKGPHGVRTIKHYFELCVLRKLERALKCKEIWVEGAYRFRNPDDDLPEDWGAHRVEYYGSRGLPLDAEAFIAPFQDEMFQGLESFNQSLATPNDNDVSIYYPGGGKEGFFHVPKISKRPECPVIQEIKHQVLHRWGVLDLLDILLEAERQVNFSRFFQTSGQRQVITPEEHRERLLLVLFSLGTNLSLTHIYSAANPSCSYDDLRYFRSRFITPEAMREAIGALVNRVLEVRNPAIWGRGTACASDGKRFGAWDQNLMTEWNPHYGSRGVMAYWHVDTNALCIYSQLKNYSSSEVATMLEGLVRHDTEMRVESHFADSHGQSEVAFAFCRLLGIKLMPRLKRIKRERLYLPEKGMGERLPNLAGVCERPIRWNVIKEQYDEMVKHVIAVIEGTGPTDSILRRFNRYNSTHPTYKAFLEAGKAEKTIFLCRYLPNPLMRHEVFDGLNVIENWNSCNNFIFFGRKMIVQTNDPSIQELAILALHLLQNSLILVNTHMVERVIKDSHFLERMEPEDLKALTPLFTSHINPYGDFVLDFNKPSILEVA